MSLLFNAMGGGTLPGQLGDLQSMMQKFNQFRSTFQGDPRAEVQRLLNSGEMTQQQYNQLQSMATQLQKMMGGFR